MSPPPRRLLSTWLQCPKEPGASKDSSMAAPSIGGRIRVHWPSHDVWYEGTVQDMRTEIEATGHVSFAVHVHYDDGEFRWHSLHETKHELLPPSTLMLPSPSVSTGPVIGGQPSLPAVSTVLGPAPGLPASAAVSTVLPPIVLCGPGSADLSPGLSRTNSGHHVSVQPPHPLGVVPPAAAALPSISLPAGVQAMVMTSSGMAVASPSQWPPAAQAELQLHLPPHSA